MTSDPDGLTPDKAIQLAGKVVGDFLRAENEKARRRYLPEIDERAFVGGFQARLAEEMGEALPPASLAYWQLRALLACSRQVLVDAGELTPEIRKELREMLAPALREPKAKKGEGEGRDGTGTT